MGRLRCGAGCGDLVEISTRGDDGSEVTLRACGTCDTRSWSRDGVVTDLGDLLAAVGGAPRVLLRAS